MHPHEVQAGRCFQLGKYSYLLNKLMVAGSLGIGRVGFHGDSIEIVGSDPCSNNRHYWTGTSGKRNQRCTQSCLDCRLAEFWCQADKTAVDQQDTKSQYHLNSRNIHASPADSCNPVDRL